MPNFFSILHKIYQKTEDFGDFDDFSGTFAPDFRQFLSKIRYFAEFLISFSKGEVCLALSLNADNLRLSVA